MSSRWKIAEAWCEVERKEFSSAKKSSYHLQRRCEEIWVKHLKG